MKILDAIQFGAGLAMVAVLLLNLTAIYSGLGDRMAYGFALGTAVMLAGFCWRLRSGDRLKL